jgi:hypothetical protein
MNSASAMKKVDSTLKKDFKYLYKRQNMSMKIIPLTYQMDSNTHRLQMANVMGVSFAVILIRLRELGILRRHHLFEFITGEMGLGKVGVPL